MYLILRTVQVTKDEIDRLVARNGRWSFGEPPIVRLIEENDKFMYILVHTYVHTYIYIYTYIHTQKHKKSKTSHRRN